MTPTMILLFIVLAIGGMCLAAVGEQAANLLGILVIAAVIYGVFALATSIMGG